MPAAYNKAIEMLHNEIVHILSLNNNAIYSAISSLLEFQNNKTDFINYNTKIITAVSTINNK